MATTRTTSRRKTAPQAAPGAEPAPRIAALIGPGPLPLIAVNAVAAAFGPVTVIVEDKEPTGLLLRRRRRLLGPVQVAGQIAFGLALKPLHRLGAARKRAIMAAAGLDPEPPRACPVHHVPSVNSDECRALLRAARPQAVLVVGTRLIRAETLGCVDAPFINYHAGLNPEYRGMNGGYWALAAGDAAHAGVTVHLVDEGVDTGAPLYTATFRPERGDTIVTYPYLQGAVANPLIVQALADALDGTLKPVESRLPGRQWFHPTLWGYLWTGLTRGVW